MLWASGNDYCREWIQQVVALLVGQGAFILYPALSKCDYAAERLTRWLTYQLPRVKQAHPGCPIHQWLNSIGAQVIVEKWQSPEQWPNLYWLPLPEVDGHPQGGLVLLPAHLLPVYRDGTIQTKILQANTPAQACIFWCITPLSKTGKRATLHPKQQNRAFCLPNSPEQMGKSCTGLLLSGLRKDNQKRNGNVISHQINLALLHHLCEPENDVWITNKCFGNEKVQRFVLEKRLQQLDEDIAQKQQARALLAALLGEGSLRFWHQQTDKLAPDAHLDWLKQQGFNEQQALYLKWLSKDMNEHDQYMADFMTVFQRLERWGPGSDADTLKALSMLPTIPTKLIDIGCGKGFSTRILAKHTQAEIVAVDNEQSALDELGERLTEQGLDTRVVLSCASMTDLPFSPESFDCIWSEAAAYIMGVEQALTQWRKLLTDSGFMVISDLVWLTDNPSQEAVAFWEGEYPDMQTIEKRLGQMRQADFDVIDHFTLSEQAWRDYYQPLKARVAEVKASMPNSNAVMDIEREIAIYERYLGEFGYHMFVLRKGA